MVQTTRAGSFDAFEVDERSERIAQRLQIHRCANEGVRG